MSMSTSSKMDKTLIRRRKNHWVKGYLGFSLILSPAQERFLKHMADLYTLEQAGYKTDYTRREYMEIMGLGEYVFDSTARSLLEMELIVRVSESSRNHVHYRLNPEGYEKLVRLASATSNHKRLISWIEFNLRKLGRTLVSVTDDEIDSLGP